MQSQRNYGSFLSKSDLHGTILYTILAQNCPKGKRQWLNKSNLLFPDGQRRTGGSNCEMFEIPWCMIKIFRGGRGGDTFETPSPPTNNFCLYPLPVLRCFWKDPLMTPTTHHPTSSTFHCYPPPHPPPLPPLKILIMHVVSIIIGSLSIRTRS